MALLRSLALLLAVLFAACVRPAVSGPPPVEPTVVLISIDGFRHDYLERYAPPTLSAIARAGVRAKALIPAFPTKTFPNHYTAVTGLYPAHHGIIANNMYDPAMGAYFSLSRRDAVADARWWGGEPIWVTAEKQGQRAATLFWPGSEAAIGGVRPSYWLPYEHGMPGAERIDQVLAWLDLPAGERPTFLTLYFSDVDEAGHDHGPESAETGAAVAAVDRHLARLVEGLEARGLRDEVNLVLISDHGMAATSPERLIVLDDYIDPDAAQIVDLNPVLMLNPKPGQEDLLYEGLKRAPHLSVYRRDEVPEPLHFRGHPRIPALIAIADEGWTITTRSAVARGLERFHGGNHGYVPDAPSMGGLFVADGPAFRDSLEIGPFDIVHLYNLLAAVLRLEPAPNDGGTGLLGTVLRPHARRD